MKLMCSAVFILSLYCGLTVGIDLGYPVRPQGNTNSDEKPLDITVIIREPVVIAIEGTTARLECYVDASDIEATLVWSRANGLPQGSTQEGGLLNIPNVQQSYSGTYICTAVTPFGEWVTNTAMITVRPNTEYTVAPEATINPQKITIAQGTTGTIRCEVSGRPVPTVVWSKSREELTSRHQISGNMLRIVNAQMEDGGIYICRAENTVGVSQDWVIVEVERTTNVNGDTQTVNIGERVEMECVISGASLPTVKWSRLDGQLLDTSTVSEVFLVIPQVRIQDAGTYVCTAENVVGTVEQRVNLFVRGGDI